MTFDPASAAARGYARCHSCGRVETTGAKHCPVCESPLHLRKPASLERTVAFTLAAGLLYFPANLLPVLRIESSIKGEQVNTILSGVIQFWEDGDYPVALIIFTASVVIPLIKVLAIIVLCFAVRSGRSPATMTRLYRMTEYIGRWSMVDVFVVAILVGVVQLGSVLQIEPGGGAFAFAGVVVLTMLAAHSFDPRLVWDAAAAKGRTHRVDDDVETLGARSADTSASHA
ncbi:MAG TPA: paraquat-inducible protein A [Chthoniobacter sp.]|nr:paraquat-inducible protein A [Chthoniobacter sp.]